MMNRVLIGVMAAAVGMAACGSKNPNTPSNQPVVFTVQMSPANEVPPVTNAESTARGTAVITFTTQKDSSGNIMSAKADFNATLTGFPASTTGITLAHIHPGAAGVAGQPIVPVPGVSAATVPVTNGNASFNITGIDVPADTATKILNDPASYYFNVHTALNGAGVMRGQLR